MGIVCWRSQQKRERAREITREERGKSKSHYPKWKITRSLDAILEEIGALQRAQVAQTTAT
jgi:hypothetical protein